MSAAGADRRAAVIEAFDVQIRACRELGAPFTERLLIAARADIVSGGWLARRIGDWQGRPGSDALPLRVAGALHALVLTQRAPGLARRYPPHESEDDAALWATALAAMQANEDVLDDYLASAPQTNEIGRAVLLSAGFSDIAARRRMPLRLLEVGASAGLNLLWDRFRYRLGATLRGDRASPVEIACDWSGPLPPDVSVEVQDRRGCDLAPIDVADPAQRQRLRSYIWPDQPERLARIDAAIGLALRSGRPLVDAAEAATWLPDRLAAPVDGAMTVVVHTIVWMYLTAAMQDALRAAIDAAGERATDRAPLAWLRFEFQSRGRPPQLELTEWPGGVSRTLAQAHPHGRWVHWLASAS